MNTSIHHNIILLDQSEHLKNIEYVQLLKTLGPWAHHLDSHLVRWRPRAASTCR